MAKAATDSALIGEERERDRLWDRTFDALYDTAFNYIEVSAYIRTLDGINLAAVTLAAVSAGSGGLAKLTVWKSGGGETAWITLLVVGALAGAHRVGTGLSHKLPTANKLVAELGRPKHDLEELTSVMRANPAFNVRSVRSDYKTLMKRFKKLQARCPVSVLLPTWLRHKFQGQTNRQLVDLIDRGTMR